VTFLIYFANGIFVAIQRSNFPIGYFGLPGSFAHEVALKHFPKKVLESFPNMAQGFEKLKQRQLDRIVVPFENSIGGAVPDTLDQLIFWKIGEMIFL